VDAALIGAGAAVAGLVPVPGRRRWWAGAAVVAILLGLPHSFLAAFLLQSPHHVATCLFCLLAVALLAGGRLGGWRWAAGTGLLAVSVQSDPIALAVGVAPVAAAGVVDALRRRRPAALAAPLAAAAGAVPRRRVAGALRCARRRVPRRCPARRLRRRRRRLRRLHRSAPPGAQRPVPPADRGLRGRPRRPAHGRGRDPDPRSRPRRRRRRPRRRLPHGPAVDRAAARTDQPVGGAGRLAGGPGPAAGLRPVLGGRRDDGQCRAGGGRPARL